MSDKQEKLDYDKLCKDVFDIDKKIRSARVINNRGKLEAGGMKDGLVALEQAKKDEMLFMEISLRVRMRHEFDEEFGPVDFSLSYRGKIVVMSFPLADEKVLFVTSERDLDLGQVPFKILKLIKN